MQEDWFDRHLHPNPRHVASIPVVIYVAMPCLTALQHYPFPSTRLATVYNVETIIKTWLYLPCRLVVVLVPQTTAIYP